MLIEKDLLPENLIILINNEMQRYQKLVEFIQLCVLERGINYGLSGSHTYRINLDLIKISIRNAFKLTDEKSNQEKLIAMGRRYFKQITLMCVTNKQLSPQAIAC